MNRKMLVILIATALLIPLSRPRAQQAPIPRVGVILQGGPWYAVVEGLRDGLKELRVLEGKQFALDIRDAGGDLKAVEEAARSLEQQKAALIYTAATSVTLAARGATTRIPIVFCAGTDPVSIGLVESFAKPGGRFTGVHILTTDLTAKRMEILKDIVPNLNRVMTFYDPRNPSARESVQEAREAAPRLKVEFIERQVASAEELQAALRTLRVGEADAYVAVSDAMVDRHAQFIIDTAKAKGLPTMFYFESLVARGGLASYSVNYHEGGRQSAKHVQRILAGANPKDLPVEAVDRLVFVVNMKTAQQIGLTIPQSTLLRVDKVLK